MKQDLPEGAAIVYCEAAFGTPQRQDRPRTRAAHPSLRAALDPPTPSGPGATPGRCSTAGPNGIPGPALAGRGTGNGEARRPGGRSTSSSASPPTAGACRPVPAPWSRTRSAPACTSTPASTTFLSEDTELAALAAENGVRIRDVRRPPERSTLHFFSGRIEEVESCADRRVGHGLGRRQAHDRLEARRGARGRGSLGGDDRHRADRVDAGGALRHRARLAGQRLRLGRDRARHLARLVRGVAPSSWCSRARAAS